MKSFKWKNIPVNIPDTKIEWFFFAIIPCLSTFIVLIIVLIDQLK